MRQTKSAGFPYIAIKGKYSIMNGMSNNIVDIESKHLRYENVLAIPSVHSRAYFALAVREAFTMFKPDAIAIEHPHCFNEALRSAVSRLPEISMIVRNIGNEGVYIPIDPTDSIIEGVRLAIDEEIPFFAIDKDITYFPTNSHYMMPDDYLLSKIGLDRFYKEILLRYSMTKDDNDIKREYHMAYNINKIRKEYKRVLVIVGISHWESILGLLKTNIFKDEIESDELDGEYNIYTIHKDSIEKSIGEMPFVAYMYETFRNGGLDTFDKTFVVETIFREAVTKYKLPISKVQQQKMMIYLRNLCLLENKIIPDSIDILTAAKCMINNDYALEIMDGISYYPYHGDEDERYPTIKLNFDPTTKGLEGFLKNKSIRLHKHDNIWGTSLKKINVTTRPKEKYDGEWQNVWDNSTNLLSHVPEDSIMEKNMNVLRDKIRSMLTEDKMRIEPFRTSIKDGIDLRETIRNYYKKEIYVKEYPKMKGNIGNMVVIFDDKHDDNYDWNIVWYSEAHDDSDLILYSTEPGMHLIGPGISKCHFGGYASLMPPQGPHNVWDEYQLLKDKDMVENYADLLLYSAILYSDDKYVGYIAPNQPSFKLKELAKTKSVEIIHIPLTTFSSETLRKLRNFHVLGTKRLRNIANDYII